MANKNIQMTQRNSANTGWDDLFPKTTPENLIGSYGTATGTNALILNLVPAVTNIAAGLTLTFKNTTANTGAASLNVNGLGIKTLAKNGGIGLTAGNLKAGGIYTVVYDGSSFILQGEGGGQPIPGTQTYVTPGTFNFVVPDGISRLIARVWGAGGAGGGGLGTTQAGGWGGAGGAGAYLMASIPVTPGQTLSVVVGKGGNPTSTGNGGVGGSSSVGTYIAYGGGGGAGATDSRTAAYGGTGGTLSATGVTGGSTTNPAPNGVKLNSGDPLTLIAGFSGGSGNPSTPTAAGSSPSDMAPGQGNGSSPSEFFFYQGGRGGSGAQWNSNGDNPASAGVQGGGGGGGIKYFDKYHQSGGGGDGKIILVW